MRPSTRGRWRALTLTLVYVLIAAHLIHWKTAGRTVTPLEPSESMQTLEQGLVNAGFVLFSLALLSTLVLGRWFCGWGCHVIALQDLCTWLLKKLGIRPKPFRSRLLVYVPLLAALYMFVWPSVLRFWRGGPHPELVAHLTTEDFWATFPSVWISVLTLFICGFLIVYLLGNKGFCTYGCPYGGFFAVADQLAPGKIRVTDDCNGCGHCTASCTSNVRVHEEVRDYGMVVDPGCMKCTDCVSVCPNDALYFGFGKPAVARARSVRSRPQRRYDYNWPEEIALAACFVVSLYAFRGLYDAVPFLLALGLSSICAFWFVQTARVFYLPALRWRQFQLRAPGRITLAGWSLVGLSVLLMAFIAHASVLQYHVREGNRLAAQARDLQTTVGAAGDAVADATRRSITHLRWAHRYGMFPMAKVEAQLGSLHLFLDEPRKAERHLVRAMELAPDYAVARYKWAELLARRGELPAAVAELHQAVRDNPALADARRDLLGALRQLGRLPEAVSTFEWIAEVRPHDAAARVELAVLLAETGDLHAGIDVARQVARELPDYADGHFKLGLLLAESGHLAEALVALERTIELNPDSVGPRIVLAQVATRLARHELALTHLGKAQRLAPLNPAVLRAWVYALAQTGNLPAAIETAEAAGPEDLPARYALAFLYRAVGDPRAAAAYDHARALQSDLPPP